MSYMASIDHNLCCKCCCIAVAIAFLSIPVRAWQGHVAVTTPRTQLLLHADEGSDLRLDYYGPRSATADELNNGGSALTECCFKKLPDPTWWTRVLKPQADRYPIAYLLVWRNAGPQEFFGPVPGTQTATDFRNMISSKNILMLKDIQHEHIQ